jgi:hypothetical protein
VDSPLKHHFAFKFLIISASIMWPVFFLRVSQVVLSSRAGHIIDILYGLFLYKIDGLRREKSAT